LPMPNTSLARTLGHSRERLSRLPAQHPCTWTH
jgi:hypothetical protein